MKKHVIMFLIAIMAASAVMSQNYDFSDVAPTGQTLYYKIVNGEAQVTSQNDSRPYYSDLSIPSGPRGDLTIPGSVTFGGTRYSVTSIGNYAFYECSLTSVTIPNSVISIGSHAFNSCSLTSVTIPNSVISMGVNAFANCNSLSSVNYTGTIAQWCGINFGGRPANPIFYAHNLSINGSPVTNLVIPDGVTEIKEYAFSYCSPLTSLTLPNTVTSIGRHAFEYCTGLSSVTIPSSMTSIGTGIFYGCSGLTSVTIPNSVTSIDSSAFLYCEGLTTLTIPNSVTNIGPFAFEGCTGLTSVTIPNSVTSISTRAFDYCPGLNSITVASGNTHYDSRNNCNAIIETATNTLITGCKNTIIPNSVTSIGDGAFYGCNDLMSVSIPNSVTSIGVMAFVSCYHLTSVTIPNSVTNIGDNAFWYCTGLTSVTIGNSVTSIGAMAFEFCSGLTEIISLATVAPTVGAWFSQVPNNIPVYVPCGSLASYQSVSGWNYFTNIQEDCSTATTATEEHNIRTCTGQTLRFLVDNGTLTATVVGYVGQCEGGLTVPAWFSINDVRYTVTAIGPRAFQNCTGLTEVTLPVTITLVDEEAFKGCSGLLKVDMK